MTNHTISARQGQALFFTGLLGISMVRLPSLAAALGGTWGWVWLGVGALGWAVMAYLAGEGDGLFLIETAPGRVVLLLLAIKNAVLGAVWLRYFAETISQLLLPRTPLLLTEIVTLGVIAYGVFRGPACRGRTAEVLWGLMVVTLGLLCAFSASNVEVQKLIPSESFGGVWTAVLVFFSGFGLEDLLFLGKYTKEKRRGSGLFHTGAVLAASMMALTALSLAIFGARTMAARRYPVLQLMDTIDFPLLFLERQDVWMTGIWIGSAILFLWGVAFWGSWQWRRGAHGKVQRPYAIFFLLLMGSGAAMMTSQAIIVKVLVALSAANGLCYALIGYCYWKTKRKGGSDETHDRSCSGDSVDADGLL